jgi:ATP-dependent RNA helicase DeaD
MKFEELNLKPELLKSTTALGYVDATEIQEKCIPAILGGRDIVGQSQTGSGKTAAFGLPMLQNIVPGAGIQAIILTPTRELSVQVHDTLKVLARFTNIKFASIYGGVAMGPQVDALKRADIVVGTPGRVMDHLERKTFSIHAIRYFVLDEADKMLEMGFVDDIKTILRYTPKTKQSLMFSATMPTAIKTIIQHNFNDPTYIKGQMYVDRSLLKQTYYNIESQEKFSLLTYILKLEQNIALVFCATRHEVDLVTENLNREGVKTMGIHGGLTQNRRLQVVDMLRKEHIHVVVATDVAARGLDIKNITHVINYDLPRSSDEYIHRIGRTARAGESGEAITLLTHADYGKFQLILSDRTLKIARGDLPKFPQIRFERGSRGGFQGRPHQGRNFTNRESRPSPSGGFRGRPSGEGRGRGDGRSRFGSDGGSRGGDGRSSRGSGARFGRADR